MGGAKRHQWERKPRSAAQCTLVQRWGVVQFTVVQVQFTVVQVQCGAVRGDVSPRWAAGVGPKRLPLKLRRRQQQQQARAHLRSLVQRQQLPAPASPHSERARRGCRHRPEQPQSVAASQRGETGAVWPMRRVIAVAMCPKQRLGWCRHGQNHWAPRWATPFG